MKLTKFGKKTFSLVAIALIVIGLIIGAVLMFTGKGTYSEAHKAYNLFYMAVCVPIGIAGVSKLTDFID